MGTGLNIPEGQIISQIDVLNEDFRRLNADKSNTPTQFASVAADIEIQFALAQRDPEGLATDGINRVKGSKTLWEVADNYELKSLSYWPAEDYLNIWVTDMGSDYLGLAQFPISDLQGLEDSSNSRLTDGVIVDYEAFGSVLKFPSAQLKSQYDRGRTATHEIGHFLGLRHIWGDGGCNVDDYCDDTPLAQTDHAGLGLCTFPGPNSCTNDSPELPDMFQNYMDYTDDICMNLFTLDQKTRIRTVIDNSPRRASLTTSLGNEPPVTVANDLGIRNVITPTYSVCGDSFIPTLEIRNYGTNPITSYTIRTSINSSLVNESTLSTNLNTLDIEVVDLPSISLTGYTPDTLSIQFEITSINGGTDQNNDNDLVVQEVILPDNALGSIRVNFTQFPDNWVINNVDGLSTWEIVDATNDEINNKALFLNCYDYENEGAIDLFTSPIIDLTGFSSAQLSFDVAYSKYPNIDNEALLVIAASKCDNPLTNGDTLYFKAADALKTVPITSGSFSPSSSGDWRHETIDLASYIGRDDIQISFISKNGYGNNLYLDNISVDEIENRIISPSPASCVDGQPLIVEVVNNELTSITTVDLVYSIDQRSAVTKTFTLTAPLEPGFSTRLTETIPELGNGQHFIEAQIILPNSSSSSTLTYSYHIDASADEIPIIENLDDLSQSSWIIANHDKDLTWENNTSQGRDFINVLNSIYSSIDEEDWLISPSLNFTDASSATLTFDVAYSGINQPEDELQILLSTDCGLNFDRVLYNKSGENLATGDFNGNPTPANWITETIDLNEFLEFSEVRIAFVNINRNGNNINLDNIEIYSTQYLADVGNILFPNPTFDGLFKIQFDLNQKENVTISIFNRNGELVSTADLPNTLNQQYNFNIENQSAGIYFINIIGESFNTTKKIIKPN